MLTYPMHSLPKEKMSEDHWREWLTLQTLHIVDAGRLRVLAEAVQFYAEGNADSGAKAEAALKIAGLKP